MNTIDKNSDLLEEGKVYPFLVSDILDLPGDQHYYIMTDPWGKKYLMPLCYYPHYAIEKGQTLNCQVNKVNCQGKVFLEPEHPLYKIGEVYEFSYLRNDVITRKNGDQYSVMVVRDAYGLEGYITIFKARLYASPPTVIKARVTRIKKARVYLSELF